MRASQALMCALLFLLIAGCSSKVQLLTKENIGNMPPNHGVVIIGLQSDFLYERLIINGAEKKEFNQDVMKNANPYLILTLKEGNYHFDKIWLNQYTYVNFQDQHDEDIWKFTVSKNTINYLGNMVITQSGRGYYYPRIKNNASQALQHMEKHFNEMLKNYPMINTAAPLDPFFAEIAELKELAK